MPIKVQGFLSFRVLSKQKNKYENWNVPEVYTQNVAFHTDTLDKQDMKHKVTVLFKGLTINHLGGVAWIFVN